MKLIVLYLCFLSFQGISQLRIESKGDHLPDKFRKNNSENIDVLIAQDSLLLKESSKKAFYVSNNYFLDNLYNSGLVIFGHEINIYMEGIVDELLKDDQETRKQVNVYLLKSTVPNAFTTLDGSIFINVGLFARLSSKDELAFVLAHEIAHFIKGHGIEKQVKNEEIEGNKNKGDKRSDLNSTLQHCLFSQEKEIEADLIGLTLFENSNYSWSALSPLFTTLKYANLPVFECELSASFLESQYLNVTDSILLDGLETHDFNAIFEEDSKFLTHPAPDERLKLLQEQAKKTNAKVVSDEQFNSFVSMCLFETNYLYNDDYDFFSAMYLAKYLGEKGNNDVLADYEMVRALYGISKFRTNKIRDYIKPSLNQRYSEFFYNTYDFLRKETSPLDVCAIAIAQGYKYLEKHTDRKAEIQTIIATLWDDYDLLKDSVAHKFVKFDVSCKTEDPFEKTILFERNDAEEISLDKQINFSNLVIVNPQFSLDITRAANSTLYFLKSSQLRKKYIENLASTWVLNNSLLLDSKTSPLEDVQGFIDITLLTNFYQESRLTRFIPNYVSRYSIEIKEYLERTNKNQLCLIGSQPLYGSKEDSRHFVIILDLLTGEIIYSHSKRDKSSVSLSSATAFSNRTLKELLSIVKK